MPRGAHLPRLKKGERIPGSGRKKGTPNKITVSMKAAVYEAFNEAGGVEALTRYARRDPKGFYNIAAKLIPTELVGKGGKPLIPPEVKLPTDPIAAAAAYREIMKGEAGDE